VKLSADEAADRLIVEVDGKREQHALHSEAGFAALSRLWVRVGWSLKYQYGFAWMGRPVIQLPEDLVRVQEAIYAVRPTLIIETGVAHGGSLVFYASLFRAMGIDGRVIGVDIEIRPHTAARSKRTSSRPSITLIEGSSIDPRDDREGPRAAAPADRVLVLLDSNHTRAHVTAELEAYAPLVSVGSYIVATDGIMEDLADVPRGEPGWLDDNPKVAAAEFARRHPEFELADPPQPFTETTIRSRITHWPSGWLRRRS
jgi:cephalosporin hydroxylase